MTPLPMPSMLSPPRTSGAGSRTVVTGAKHLHKMHKRHQQMRRILFIALLVALPAFGGTLTGNYEGRWLLNGGIALKLEKNGAYDWDQYLLYCLRDEKGNLDGWSNFERGTWSEEADGIHLKASYQCIENTHCEREFFDAFRVLHPERRNGRECLVGRNGCRQLVLCIGGASRAETLPP